MENAEKQPENKKATLEPSVIFQDDDLLVLNKPSGLAVHSDGRTNENTLADWVLQKYPGMTTVGEPWKSPEGKIIPRPGIVHRLDRETSGVMVLAKNPKSFEYLKQQFQERSIRKTYRAFVYGKLKEKKGIIEKEIGKSRSDFRKWSAEYGARGKMREARTEYEVLSESVKVYLVRSSDSVTSNEVSYLEIHPKTGRTHQIRVHLKAIGHPVLCDKLYAPKSDCLLGFSRLALHAFSISFANMDGNLFEFESPVPKDFEKALEELSSE